MSEIYQHLSSVYNELNYNTFKQKIYQNMLHLKLKLETELDMDFSNFEYYFNDISVHNGICIPIMIKIDDEPLSLESINETLNHIPMYKIPNSKTKIKELNRVNEKNEIQSAPEINDDVITDSLNYLTTLVKNEDDSEVIKIIENKCSISLKKMNGESRYIIDQSYFINEVILVSGIDLFYADNVIVINYNEFLTSELGEQYISIGTFKIKNGEHIFDKNHIALVSKCSRCNSPFIFDYYTDGLQKICYRCMGENDEEGDKDLTQDFDDTCDELDELDEL